MSRKRQGKVDHYIWSKTGSYLQTFIAFCRMEGMVCSVFPINLFWSQNFKGHVGTFGI